MKKHYNKDGTTSAYGFSCGYIQQKTLKRRIKSKVYTGIFKIEFEHGVYSVEAKIYENGKFYCMVHEKQFHKINEAKKFFKQIVNNQI